MELTSLRGIVDRVGAHLPSGVRSRLKRVYQRGPSSRPVDPVRRDERRGTAATGREGVPLRVCRAGPLPDDLWWPSPLGPTASPAGRNRPHLCLVTAGRLDPRLDVLLTCERHGVPIVCVAPDRAALATEIAGVASALIVPTASLADQAGAVLPSERVTVAPAMVATEGLPARGLQGQAPRGVVLSFGSQPTVALRGTPAEDITTTAVPPDAGLAELTRLAATALAVMLPATVEPTEIARVAALAACGVPPIGDVEQDHPLAGLASAVRSDGHLPTAHGAAAHALRGDAELRHAAGVRARRYALAELSVASAMRSLLPRLDQPVTEHGVVAVARLTEASDLPRLVANLRRQRELSAVVLVAASPSSPTLAAEELEGLTLDLEVARPGQDLRRALRRSSADHVALFDPTCWYGPDHVHDLRLARENCGHAIVGRRAHHRLLPGGGGIELVAGPEETAVDHLLSGGSLLPMRLARSGLRAAAAGEEFALHDQARKRGAHLYAIHRFGFLRTATPMVTGPGPLARERAFPEGDGGVPLNAAK